MATVVGLLTIVLARSYFRKQPATDNTTETQATFGERPKRQQADDEADATVQRDVTANSGDARRDTETKTRVTEVVDDVPPLEGDAGSGDNQSQESGSDVEAEAMDEDSNVAT